MERRRVMKMVVAESHGGERRQRKDRLQEKWAGKAGFRPTLSLIFFSFRTWNLLLFIGVKSCLHRGTNSSLWFNCEGYQPLAQGRHGTLSICSCRLPEVASLEWCHFRLCASEPVTTIPKCRGMSGDQFRAQFGKFGGR